MSANPQTMTTPELDAAIQRAARDWQFYSNCDSFNSVDRKNERAARREFYALTAERDRRAMAGLLVTA